MFSNIWIGSIGRNGKIKAAQALVIAGADVNAPVAKGGYTPLMLASISGLTAEPIARLGSDNRVEEGGWNILSDVAAYPKPLLVFAAQPGESVMSDDDVAVLRATGGVNVTVREYPDHGHNLHRTAFERFVADLTAFLESQTPIP